MQYRSHILGSVIAIADTELVWVTEIKHRVVTVVDIHGATHRISLKKLGYSKKRIRATLAFLYGEQCAKCGAVENLTIDHIKPRISRGSNGLENFQLLCEKCNQEKDSDYIDYRVFDPRILFR